jgi:hypothetical protein
VSSEWDPFKGDSGLKDDYDGTVTTAEFVQGQRGGYSLELTIADEDQDETTIRLGVGSGWVSLDGGETVENEGSGKARFNERTGYQRFIGAAMKSGGAEVLRQRSNDEYAGRGPMHAALWNGLQFHFDVVHVPGQRPNGEGVWEDVEGGIPTVLPTKYLGEGAPQQVSSAGVGDAKTGRASTKANPSATQTNSGTAGTSASGSLDIHPKVLEEMTSLAHTLDYGSWVDQVMMMKDDGGTPLAKNRPLMIKLGDESWYEELRG